VIALTAIAGAAAAFFATPATTTANATQYQATHRLILQAAGDGGTERGSARSGSGSLAAIAAVATGADVQQRVADVLEYRGTPATLGKRLEAVADAQSNTISISYMSTRPRDAEAIANAFATQLVALLDERAATQRREAADSANQRMQTLQAETRRLDARIAATPLVQQPVLIAERDALVRQYSVAYERFQEASQAPQVSGLTTLQPAVAEKVNRGFQAPRSRVGRMALMGVVGLLLGAGLALVIERLDTRIGDKASAERAFGLPVLAEVPPVPLRLRRRPKIMTSEEPNSVVAESYRSLRTSLMLMHHADGSAWADGATEEESLPHVVLISSPNPGEGKTTSAANLAASYAEAGKTVLVIDCDFRHPRIDRYLGVANDKGGLGDVLLGGPRAPTLRDVMRKTAVRNVWLIPTGPPIDNPAELLARGQDTLASASELADVVILDTPPVLAINDASELVPMCDAVVLVCRSGRTTVEAAERSAELLHRIGAPLRGVALIGVASAPSTRGYYYYYASAAQGGGVLGWRRLFQRRRPPRTPAPPPQKQPRSNAGGPARDRRPVEPSRKGKKRKSPAPAQAPPAKGGVKPPAAAPPAPAAAPPSATPPAAAVGTPKQSPSPPTEPPASTPPPAGTPAPPDRNAQFAPPNTPPAAKVGPPPPRVSVPPPPQPPPPRSTVEGLDLEPLDPFAEPIAPEQVLPDDPDAVLLSDTVRDEHRRA
jgi:capsular exopolysaccharide synthesis family protein